MMQSPAKPVKSMSTPPWSTDDPRRAVARMSASRRDPAVMRCTPGSAAGPTSGAVRCHPLWCGAVAVVTATDRWGRTYASSRSTATREAGSSRGAATSLTFGTNEAASEVAATISWSATDRMPSRPSWAISSRM